MFKRNLVILLLITFSAVVSFGQDRTIVRDRKAKQMLLGRHKISLQWISWDHFGIATATEKRGIVYLKGRQDGRGQSRGDYVTVDGVVTEIDAKQFTFEGKIVTKISHINGGEPCERKGVMNFRITGSRKYWRLQQMDNPCDQATDYVDIFLGICERSAIRDQPSALRISGRAPFGERSYSLALQLYSATREVPKDELYGLTGQFGGPQLRFRPTLPRVWKSSDKKMLASFISKIKTDRR